MIVSIATRREREVWRWARRLEELLRLETKNGPEVIDNRTVLEEGHRQQVGQRIVRIASGTSQVKIRQKR